MNPRIVLLFALLTHACFGGFKPAVVDGRSVRNPTIGFRGYSITFPEGYAQFRFAEDKNSPSPAIGQWAWRMAVDLDEGTAGLRTHEIIVFESGQQRALALGVAVMNIEFAIAELPEFERTMVMDHVARTSVFPSGEVLQRTKGKVGDHLTAKVVRKFDRNSRTFINAVYYAFGELKELYTLNGICAEADKAGLLQDMDAVMASLVTRKAKKK